MLGKSVLPRVLVRVTLLLPAHLPVLIGQRVSHSGGCRLVLCGREYKYVKCEARAKNKQQTHFHHYIDKLTVKIG